MAIDLSDEKKKETKGKKRIFYSHGHMLYKKSSETKKIVNYALFTYALAV